MDKLNQNVPPHHPDHFRVSGATDNEKEDILEDFSKMLVDNRATLVPGQKDLMKRHEYPKSKQELRIINLINKRTNKIIREAGGNPHDIPPDNIYLLPDNLCKLYMGEKTGICHFSTQMILLSASQLRNNSQYFASLCFHEMMHLKAPLLLQADREAIPELVDNELMEEKTATTEDLVTAPVSEKKKDSVSSNILRSGISVFSTLKHDSENKSHNHFIGLHEAIIAYAQSKLNKEILELPILKKEKEFFESEEVQKFIEMEVAKDRSDISEVLSVEPDPGRKGSFIIKWNYYREQRKVLIYVMEEIMAKNQGKFENLDEVYKIFLKAQYNLNLGEIARLVEGVFGRGSFRILGDMGTDPSSGVKCLEAMRSMRANFKMQERREAKLIKNAKEDAIRELHHKDIDDSDPA